MKYLICGNGSAFSVWVYTPNALPKDYALIGEAVATSPEDAVAKWLNRNGKTVNHDSIEAIQYRFGKWSVRWS